MDTIQEQDLGARGPELLDRLSHGETIEIVKDGQIIGLITPAKPARTFNDWLMGGPRFDDLELPDRSKSVMRDVDL